MSDQEKRVTKKMRKSPSIILRLTSYLKNAIGSFPSTLSCPYYAAENKTVERPDGLGLPVERPDGLGLPKEKLR